LQGQEKFTIKISAIIALTYLVINLFYHLIAIWQVNFQLVGDFIPKPMLWDIAQKNIIVASALLLIGIANCVFFYYKKYAAVIVITVLAVILSALYLHSG